MSFERFFSVQFSDIDKNNIERALTAEEKTISARLSKKTASTSSELAKRHIKSVLDAHPELHEKYINQSIEELG